ncbi:MAG: hypothetical protein IT169_11910 [Bryobacterales bacterium]|nr:hypothetical protein [Bryobacterales bacterium]
MSTIHSYPISAAPAAHTPPRGNPAAGSTGRQTHEAGASFEEVIAGLPGTGRGGDQSTDDSPALRNGTRTQDATAPVERGNATPAAPPAAADGPMMMPMQQSWTPPVVPATPSAFPLHPVYGVPMVSEATLNRYIHPLQTLGTIAPSSGEAEGDIGTSVFRVAPGGMQDFVTGDGYRHRFDVEIVFPSPGNFTWQDRDATEIHPEVGEFAATALREKMAASGMDVAKLEITPFRMKGGNEARPWFLDQLVLKMTGKPDLPISLNVAMRDPAYTLETIQSEWSESAVAAWEIPS